MRTELLDPNNTESAQTVAAEAARLLNAGELVVFPTETVYGIAASTASETGLAKLRAFKERPGEQPFTVHVPDVPALGRYLTPDAGGAVQRVIRKTLPGPVTLIAEMGDDAIDEHVRKMIESGIFGKIDATDADQLRTIRERLYHERTIGLRCPDQPIAQRILGLVDAPVVASSANRRGHPPPIDADEAVAAVGDQAEANVAMIVDGGRCRYAKPSTILRVVQNEKSEDLIVEREGVYDKRFIEKLGNQMILIVCSGNTCRSPMGEAIAREILAEQRGVPIAELADQGVQVRSAGTSAFDGAPASPEGVQAMATQDLDISDHRSTGLTPQLLMEADAIYCMTQSHRDVIVRSVPAVANRTFMVDPDGDVVDPIGGSQEVYRRCADQIRQGLNKQLKES